MKTSAKGLERLDRMEYPGRLIIVGRDPPGEQDVVIYAITGRSPSSQARELVHDGKDSIQTRFRDEVQFEKKDHRLLIYNCITWIQDTIVVSNGLHTDLIVQTVRELQNRGERSTPMEILSISFHKRPSSAGEAGAARDDLTSYEPDEPNFTPRISGCVSDGAALGIAKRAADGSTIRHTFEVPLIPGRGKLISTYRGENIDPLPAFQGQPLDVTLAGDTAQTLAQSVYGALAPSGSQRDLRVAVAALCLHRETLETTISIINRHRGGDR